MKYIIFSILLLLVVTGFSFADTSSAKWPLKDYTLNRGYKQYEFKIDGCKAILLEPKVPLEGKPWLWRAEFFEAFQDTIFAFLDRGFYVAYIEVGNTHGCPDALAHWDPFYNFLTKKVGLSKKVVLEGMSRGGLYIYNWAARNTDKVAVIYGDAPVCDFKSWPAGKGAGPGSKDDWDQLIKDYHFANEAEALAYKYNPIDNLDKIAKAKIPIIHVYGDADTVVPPAENTLVLAKRYKELGGEIVLIPKAGVGHHPHGLSDPKPLLDFVLDKIKK